ncbi:MAG: hypothetical protein ABII90_07455 [Bacteroidota bacterium]
MIKIILITFTIILGLNSIIAAQECGPSCPVCSGTADGSLLAQKSFLFKGMYIPSGEEEYGVLNIRYGAFKWLDVGVGYNIKAEKIVWNARVQLLKEKEDSLQPGLILGTGSVRTGSSDQSVYFHLTKAKEFSENFGLRLTCGIASLVPEFNEIYGLAGLTFIIAEKFSPFVNFDGKNFHEGISWIATDWLSVAVLLIESKDPAISVGIRWSLPNSELKKQKII